MIYPFWSAFHDLSNYELSFGFWINKIWTKLKSELIWVLWHNSYLQFYNSKLCKLYILYHQKSERNSNLASSCIIGIISELSKLNMQHEQKLYVRVFIISCELWAPHLILPCTNHLAMPSCIILRIAFTCIDLCLYFPCMCYLVLLE
jgi:hypothetical protein